ncbi:MAG: hypothetical protein HFI75_12200 [Lachnospiraceae bacterium]|nr:hypothetical protein [Lachnospiraceae bacterium]
MKTKIISLRMERQCLLQKADEEEYQKLYRDTQPGQNVYWNGFGQPPVLSFRAAFDDIEFNRERQRRRALIKGRFAGGNVGWILPEDLELFVALYCKPLTKPTAEQLQILQLIETAGPLNIQQLKEETGLLVKQITPILHRLQEAFLIYEDQYDEDWERGWYRFDELFPHVELERYSRLEALKIVLQRFAYRMVWFDLGMVKSFYKLSVRDIKAAFGALEAEEILVPWGTGWLLNDDLQILMEYQPRDLHFVYALHRSDILYKANEPELKELAKELTAGLAYDHEPLQYLLIDGEFHGASVGHFRNGPYDLNDIVCDLPDADSRKEEIVQAVRSVNFGKEPLRFMGRALSGGEQQQE